MKILLIFLLSIATTANAAELNTTKVITCGKLNVPIENLRETYLIVSQKLEECLENKMNCEHYIWPQLFLKSGEKLTSNTPTVNLWQVKENQQHALECAEMIEENPGKTVGIIEF